MNRNGEVIFRLCSRLFTMTDGKPLEPSEWSQLAERLLQAGLQPEDLPDLPDSGFRSLAVGSEEMYRIRKLLGRGAELVSALEPYRCMGISVVTRADAAYPRMLKVRLGKRCPPLFYCAGDLKLAAASCIGFVGSRRADGNDRFFTELLVSKVNSRGYAVVSGGAKGVDSFAGNASLRNEGALVVYLADSMVMRLRNPGVAEAVRNGKLLLLSAVHPDTEFTAAGAMMRNRYIYAQSAGTVVVRAEYGTGGTWNGALDCLKHEICPLFCWNRAEYRGNQEMMKCGAVPIDADWDGNPVPEKTGQLTLWD